MHNRLNLWFSLPVKITALISSLLFSAMSLHAYDDGSSNAPAGSPQHPALLANYALRPPWRVAGVDYYVGVPAATNLVDWQSLNGSGISVNTNSGLVRVDGQGGVVFDGVDFSLHGGAILAFYNNSPGGMVVNCKFVLGSLTVPIYYVGMVTADASSPGLTVVDCIIDGGAGVLDSNGSCLISVAGGGNVVVQYNWLEHSPSQVLDVGGTNLTLDYRFNLIEDFGNHGSPGNHPNLLQWVNAVDNSALVQFNTSYQTPGMAAGEQYQFYSQLPGAAIFYPTLQYNTLIATGTNGGASTSYMIHGNNSAPPYTVGGLIAANYCDPSGAYGVFYPGSFNSGWSLTNNVDMITGKIVNGDNSESAPGPLVIQRSGLNLLLNWPVGALLEAPNLTGPWTTNNASSPYAFSSTGSQMFYRVLLK